MPDRRLGLGLGLLSIPLAIIAALLFQLIRQPPINLPALANQPWPTATVTPTPTKAGLLIVTIVDSGSHQPTANCTIQLGIRGSDQTDTNISYPKPNARTTNGIGKASWQLDPGFYQLVPQCLGNLANNGFMIEVSASGDIYPVGCKFDQAIWIYIWNTPFAMATDTPVCWSSYPTPTPTPLVVHPLG